MYVFVPPVAVWRSDLSTVKPENLWESGIEVVLNHAMYAIVGAIALEKGGLVANEVTRERILKPLGFPIDVPKATAAKA